MSATARPAKTVRSFGRHALAHQKAHRKGRGAHRQGPPPGPRLSWPPPPCRSLLLPPFSNPSSSPTRLPSPHARAKTSTRARGPRVVRPDLRDVAQLRVAGPPQGPGRRLGLQALLHELGIPSPPPYHPASIRRVQCPHRFCSGCFRVFCCCFVILTAMALLWFKCDLFQKNVFKLRD